MFFQFAVWGAWMPVLAGRLIGSLKMNGKQTGWIYGTLFLASIITPLIAGQIVDRWIATQWYLAAAHLVGGVLMLIGARQTEFKPMLIVMGAYSLMFAPTIPLANALMFQHLTDAQTQSFGILVWGPIGWTLSGLGLTAWRRVSTKKNDGRDCQVLAGVLSFFMVATCLIQPHTPPAGAADQLWPFLDAIRLLADLQFFVFIFVSFIMTALLQFYFMGTAPFLEAIGVRQKNVPAAMSIAQIAQVVAMPLVPLALPFLGFGWSLSLGVLLWLMMYAAYAATRPQGLVVASMALHGIAYAFFINVGWVYVSEAAPAGIQGSAQALLAVATFGLGMFAGTRFTGIVMDRFVVDGEFKWRSIFAVPLLLSGFCILLLLAFFK